MYEQARVFATALFLALFLTLSADGLSGGRLPTWLLCLKGCSVLSCAGSLALLKARRPAFPMRVCLGALWVLTSLSALRLFAFDAPNIASRLLLFAGVLIAAWGYTLLFIHVEKQHGAGLAGQNDEPGSPTPFFLCLPGLAAFVVGLAAHVELMRWLAASARP